MDQRVDNEHELPLIFLLVVTAVALSLLRFRALAAPRARTVYGDRLVAEVRVKGKEAGRLARAAVPARAA